MYICKLEDIKSNDIGMLSIKKEEHVIDCLNDLYKARIRSISSLSIPKGMTLSEEQLKKYGVKNR